jgi:AGZA family xanthine/uracil permease-like MFS transporter
VLLVDSLAAAAGGAASASSNTTFIESASGVAEGGRTGLTSVVVGVLFLLALFFSPRAGVIPPEATAPVLILVGYFMMTLVRDIDWSDPGHRHPGAPDDGRDAVHVLDHERRRRGFLSYTLIEVLRGRARRCTR